jgi:multidrug efflux pump subunit AcrB
MVIRNSVILIDQIETEIARGQHPWNAVIVATEHRLRPILLTAAAAILGMIPIAPTVFWGPMAYAVMGGSGGRDPCNTSWCFLPALYVALVSRPNRRGGMISPPAGSDLGAPSTAT